MHHQYLSYAGIGNLAIVLAVLVCNFNLHHTQY